MSGFEIDPARWATLNRLLDEALDLPVEKRAKWLENLPQEYDLLKPRLRALLTHAAESGTVPPLETIPKLEPRPNDPQDDSGDASFGRFGDAIGPYRLIRVIARGGMGTVWLAERSDGLLQRPVALKLPRGSFPRRGLSERMAREREILASLNHPHIAQLYDAGLTSNGQPYLALEYVEGLPIDEYAREKRLDLRGRLRLFLQVADAVAHAHARLVVHRDLKPTNILVTGEGEARLLDFGIAKILEQGQVLETELTVRAGRALTLAYASPEQITGAPISVASDVYSLGVVLYELLTQARPYKLTHDSRAALEDAVLMGDPVRPSDAAVHPSSRKSLRGDLDTILLKALKKDTEERYPTVNAFADDIERYLQGRPVLGRPDSRLYRSRKFVGRNRVEVAAAGVAFFALLVGGIAAGVGFLRATRAEAVARREAATSRGVSEFVMRLFEVSDPSEARGNSITARELLDRGASTIESELATEPAVQADLFAALGRVNESLGLYRESIALAERALALRAGEDLKTADVLVPLGRARQRMGDFEKARKALERALAIRLRRLGEDNIEVAQVLNSLGGLHGQLEQLDEAKASYERALEIARGTGGAAHVEVARSLRGLGIIQQSLGDFESSLRSHQQAQPIFKKTYGDGHPVVADGLDSIGLAFEGLERYLEARAHMERALEMRKRTLGPDHPFVAGSFLNLGRLLVAEGKLEEGQGLLERSLRIYQRAYDPESSEVMEGHRNLVVALVMRKKYDEAIPHLREVVLRVSDPRLSVDLKDPLFDDMRALPAFRELSAEVELRSSR